jgi:hypothetical protein
MCMIAGPCGPWVLGMKIFSSSFGTKDGNAERNMLMHNMNFSNAYFLSGYASKLIKKMIL